MNGAFLLETEDAETQLSAALGGGGDLVTDASGVDWLVSDYDEDSLERAAIPDYSRALVVTRFIGSDAAATVRDRMNAVTTNHV